MANSLYAQLWPQGQKGLPHSLDAPQYRVVGCPLVSQIWFNSPRASPLTKRVINNKINNNL